MGGNINNPITPGTTSKKVVSAGRYTTGDIYVGAIPNQQAGGEYTLNPGESISRAAGTYLTSKLSVIAAAAASGGGYDVYTATATSDEDSSGSYIYFSPSSTHNGVYSNVTPTYIVLYQESYKDGILWLMAHEGSICSLGCREDNDFSYY
jgi:hypothetical protein